MDCFQTRLHKDVAKKMEKMDGMNDLCEVLEQTLRECVIPKEYWEDVIVVINMRSTCFCTQADNKESLRILQKIMDNCWEKFMQPCMFYNKGPEICMETIIPPYNIGNYDYDIL